MRLRYLSTIALAGACAAHPKHEIIGSRATVVQARGAVEPVQAGSIALPRGAYELTLRFDVPRAQVVEWTVICPGAMQSGVVGERTQDERPQRLEAKVAVLTSEAGVCSVSAVADDPNVAARFEVARDIAANERRLREDSLVVRAALREYLMALGAHLRPPKPPRPPEDPGEPPSEYAIWIGGEWRWNGIEWLWERGGWSDRGPSVRDHRTSSDDTVRDHRDEQVSTVRDHRTAPEVRDHRDDPPKSESKPVVRDHRDDDSKKDDKHDRDDNAPKVRDHRR